VDPRVDDRRLGELFAFISSRNKTKVKGVSHRFCCRQEHGYYLDYQNMRATYVDNFIDYLIDWDFVGANLEAAVRHGDDDDDDTAEVKGEDKSDEL